MSCPIECQTWPFPNSKNKWIALCMFRGVFDARSVKGEVNEGTLEAAILDCRLVSVHLEVRVSAGAPRGPLHHL